MLMKEVASEVFPADLGCNAHQRGGIQHRIRNPGHEVCRPGTCGRHTHPCPSAAADIPLGSMDSTLLMAYEDMPYLSGIVIQFIVERHNGSSGIAENRIHAFFNQRKQQGLRTCYVFFLSHKHRSSYQFRMTGYRILTAPLSAEETAEA